MRYALNMPEEELKIRVGNDWFSMFDCCPKLKTLDFAVCRSPADLADDAEEGGADFQKNKRIKEAEDEKSSSFSSFTSFPLLSKNKSEGSISKDKRKKEEGKENLLSFSLLSKNKSATSAKSAGNINAGETDFLLWAEAKRGAVADILAPLAQLVLTIGKERLQDTYLPPKYLAAFDAEKIAFVEFHKIADFFTQNDFNWNVTPSDHKTREFQQILARLAQQNGRDLIHFNWDADAAELKRWIAANFRAGGTARIRITKNNFTAIYAKWRAAVKPSIGIDWDAARKTAKANGEIGILDADFYLADLLSDKNKTLKEKLRVVLNHDHYELDRVINALGLFSSARADFTDHGTAHAQFWNRYERPPKEEYWDYIIERRDLLVPQDVREVKGAFFTPSRWVELSQQYIADALGEDWQQEYTIWDCCAGTGNLLAGLTEPGRIYASTLDKADVSVMHDRIKNGANLLPGNVFQFDFLNDDLFGDKVPPTLRAILADPEKRKKLVIYINPPYAEADSRIGRGRSGVAVSRVHQKYDTFMGYAKRELYIQFLTRIYNEIGGCQIHFFSKIKNLQAPKFKPFRENFKAKLNRMFLVPADTFDNVKGDFPISFQQWDTGTESTFEGISADVYDQDGNRLNDKFICNYDALKVINDWTLDFIEDKRITKENFSLGTIIGIANDFQNQKTIRIEQPHKPWNHQYQWQITANNLIQSCVYFCARLIPEATWLNDRDQFLYPADSWAEDIDFQNDCLIYTLFHGQNRISAGGADFQKNKRIKETEDEKNSSFSSFSSFLLLSKNNLKESASSAKSAGNITPNHWIPFTETEVGAQASFASHFMSDFLRGKIKDARERVPPMQGELFGAGGEESKKRGVEDFGSSARRLVGDAINRVSTLTPAARAVYDAGLALWRYYHEIASRDFSTFRFIDSSNEEKENRKIEESKKRKIINPAPYNPDASFYDIRAYFQGFTNGKMNADSPDATYTVLIADLRAAIRVLAAQIEPKIYEHGFLR